MLFIKKNIFNSLACADNMKQLLLISFLLLFNDFAARQHDKQHVLIVDNGTIEYDLLDFADFILETDTVYSFQQVSSSEFHPAFSKTLTRENKTTGKCNFWVRLRFRIANNEQQKSWMLRLNKLYSEVTAYIVNADGSVEKQFSGRSIPLSKRSIADPEVVFRIFPLIVEKKVVVYLHVSTDLRWSSVDNIAVSMVTESQWTKSRLQTFNFLSIYAGICLLAIFYWLINYIYSRRTNYLYLIAATLTALMFCLDIYGITASLWKEHPLYLIVMYGEQLVWFPGMVASYFAITYKVNPFSDHFSKRTIYVYWIMCIVTVLSFIVTPLMLEWKYTRLVSFSLVLFCILMGSVIINTLLFRKGHKAAAFGFATILPIMVGMTSYIFTELGILPERYKILAPVGALCTVVMFFYGMVIYLRVLRQKREKESKENEKLIREQNVMLEKKVEERTAELQVTNENLAATIADLKEAQSQLIKAEKQKENEVIRTRISQDIHDDVSSELTRISWISELAKANALKGEITEMPVLLDKINTSSRETVAKLGEIIWAINPNFDTLDSLLSYMRNHISKFLTDTTIKYVINFPDKVPVVAINPELKRNLFMVLKEALNNALKYSSASEIRVNFGLEGEHYHLNISDNGVGMDGNVIHGGGNGLPNMRRRMQQVNGCCDISSEKGKGTTILLSGKLYR
jgi:signal transduction histidine kinase